MISQQSSNSPSLMVLEALAEEFKCDVMDLPPLHETIDLEAIDTLFSPPSSIFHRVLRFTYAESLVELRCDGELTVTVRPDRLDE